MGWVNRAGTVHAMQRADNAGPHTLTICLQKTFTATSAKNATLAMMDGSRKNPTTTNLVSSIDYLLLDGDVLVKLDNEVTGAVGIGGARGSNPDE